MRFESKTVIVTGAGSGIGEAYALGFTKEGAYVVVADIDASGAKSTAGKIEQTGGESLVQVVDVSRKGDVEEMVGKTVKRFGKIDVLVNNAAISFENPLVGATEEQYYRMYEVNVKGVFLCAQAVAERMIKQKKGKIVNVSSITAIVGCPDLTLYSSSKGAVLSLTRAMAVELAPHNIQVNSIVPGPTETPQLAPAIADPEARARLTRRFPLGRLGKPQDHVGAVLYLASEESNWCTGQTLVVDGGYSIA